MSKCLPGSPCYKGGDLMIYTKYPSGCTSSDCTSSGSICYPISSDKLYYSGPNLPYSGIQTLDSITISLQKIDTKLDPTSILTQILAVLATNPTLKAQLCAALSDC